MLGLCMTVALGAANAYLGLKAGITSVVFSNKHFDPVEGARLYKERLEQYLLAEDAGFDGLMLNEHLDVSSAAFKVGYESPSQFSREYSRLFGAPPLRDMLRLRNAG